MIFTHFPQHLNQNGNGWESNPPRLARRPDTDFEDQEVHRDLTIPNAKHIRNERGLSSWTFIKVGQEVVMNGHT